MLKAKGKIMNEKETNKVDILSIMVLGILIIQSILIIILLNSMRKLNTQVFQFMQSANGMMPSSNPLIGKQFIDFELTDSNGEPFILSDHLSKPTLIVFSNHQCSACQKMYPELINYLNDNPKIEVIIITSNSHDQNVEFVQNYNLTNPNVIVLEGTQEVFGLYNVNATPTFFSLDSTGIIVDSESVNTEKQIVELMKGTD